MIFIAISKCIKWKLNHSPFKLYMLHNFTSEKLLDRVLYMPSVGLCLMVTTGARRLAHTFQNKVKNFSRKKGML